ncbi:hypothetical protein D9M69_675310 [compost metagenome]
MVDGAAPGDADAIALVDQFEEDGRGQHRHFGRRVHGLPILRHDPGCGDAGCILELARQHVVGEKLRGRRDVDDPGLARAPEIGGNRGTRDPQFLRDFVLP